MVAQPPAMLIGPDGTLLLSQRKIDNLHELNLFDPPYEDGRPEKMRVAQTPLGRIGIAICADAFEETLMRQMGLYSPDLLLVPVGWAAEKERWPRYGKDEPLRVLLDRDPDVQVVEVRVGNRSAVPSGR